MQRWRRGRILNAVRGFVQENEEACRGDSLSPQRLLRFSAPRPPSPRNWGCQSIYSQCAGVNAILCFCSEWANRFSEKNHSISYQQ